MLDPMLPSEFEVFVGTIHWQCRGQDRHGHPRSGAALAEPWQPLFASHSWSPKYFLFLFQPGDFPGWGNSANSHLDFPELDFPAPGYSARKNVGLPPPRPGTGRMQRCVDRPPCPHAAWTGRRARMPRIPRIEHRGFAASIVPSASTPEERDSAREHRQHMIMLGGTGSARRRPRGQRRRFRAICVVVRASAIAQSGKGGARRRPENSAGARPARVMRWEQQARGCEPKDSSAVARLPKLPALVGQAGLWCRAPPPCAAPDRLLACANVCSIQWR